MAARESYRQVSGDDDGERACARGEHCASAVTVRLADGTTRRDPLRSPRSFCDPDRGRIEHDLGELPGQYVHLAVELGNPARRGTPVHVPFGPRVLIRVDVEALMRAFAECLCAWHERIADSQHLDFRDTGRRDSWAVGRAVGCLSAPGRVSALLALQPQPMRRACDLRDLSSLPEDVLGVVHSVYAEIDLDMDGTDAGLEILNLRYLARAVLGETRDKPEELLGVPCRVEPCDKLALRRAELPSDPAAPGFWSECAACGDRMTEEEYRDWTRRYALWVQGKHAVPRLENLPGL
jgi:hypothetical protein